MILNAVLGNKVELQKKRKKNEAFNSYSPILYRKRRDLSGTKSTKVAFLSLRF